jgi:geranylgeranyl pyrophosphate synthase
MVDEAIEDVLSSHADGLDVVSDAMRYAVQDGSRWRPILLAQTGMVYGQGPREFMRAGAAVEFLHSASIILDDMPCMDNAQKRRGKDACWFKHGEANTVLASIYLQMLAMDLLAECSGKLMPDLASRARAVILAMVRGQYKDLTLSDELADDPDAKNLLNDKNAAKTGLLIRLAVEAGACMAGAPEEDRQALDKFASDLGLAYQLVDDVSDCSEFEPERERDKTPDQDVKNHRLSAPDVYHTAAEAQQAALGFLDQACLHLASVPGSAQLAVTASRLCRLPDR